MTKQIKISLKDKNIKETSKVREYLNAATNIIEGEIKDVQYMTFEELYWADYGFNRGKSDFKIELGNKTCEKIGN